MRIPTKGDWGPISEDDIERQYAFDMFIGKTKEQAREMCIYNALNYQEELQSMPEYPFNFYALILAGYIISDESKDDSDGASSFLHMVAWMLKTQSEIIYPGTKSILISACENIASNQKFYDADINIYGDFKNVYTEILQSVHI